jgi:hypothetical protein
MSNEGLFAEGLLTESQSSPKFLRVPPSSPEYLAGTQTPNTVAST